MCGNWRPGFTCLLVVTIVWSTRGVPLARGWQLPPVPPPVTDKPDDIPMPGEGTTAEKKIVDPPGLVRLDKNSPIWIDPKRKIVVFDAEVCLDRGTLEMFACLKDTKEHESILAVDGKAFVIHAGLLAVGAKPGHPVKFDPYVPATGTEIEIRLLWVDKDGMRHNDRAQSWIRYFKTGKEMPFPFVFAGSGFWVDEMTGERHYQAEEGDLICVSNFPVAMLDIPVKSSDANADLMFEAFQGVVPPRGTKVRVVLQPVLKDKQGEQAPDANNGADPPKDAGTETDQGGASPADLPAPPADSAK